MSIPLNPMDGILTFVSQEEAKGSINVDALLDTGCLAGDFVARRIVDRFNIRPIIHSTSKLSVCSGLDNTCYDISDSVIVSVNYLNERVNKINTFTIKAIILDSSPVDIIIGRATIKKLSLVLEVPSQFHNIGKALLTGGNTSEHATKCSGCQPKEELQTSRSVSKSSPLISQLVKPTVSQTSRIQASLVLESEQLSTAPLYDDDDVDHDKTDIFKSWSTPSSDTFILSLIHFSGDEDLQSRLRTLCTEFADIFSDELPKEPADVPPFNLIVDNRKWEMSKTRAPSLLYECLRKLEWV